MAELLAAMDIGTNSCRLIIVEKSQKKIETLLRKVVTTRIGQGLGEGNLHLSREARDRTIACLIEYKEIIQQHNPEKIWLLGTQALREADNSGEFVREVKEKTGFALDIISGAKEAELSYAGAAGTLEFAETLEVPMVLDIGAGSTEIMWLVDRQIRAYSAPIGGLRLLEKPLDLSEIGARLAAGWQKAVIPPNPGPLVAVGGTATTLGAIHLKMAKFNPEALLGLQITYPVIEEVITLIESLPRAQRLALPGMIPGREDVLSWGLRIMLAAMEYTDKDCITVCDRDLLYGVLEQEDGYFTSI